MLLPDEVLRFPLDQALVIIRGQKVLKVRKFDYSRHPEAKNLVLEKTESHVPDWRKREVEAERGEGNCGEEEGRKTEDSDRRKESQNQSKEQKLAKDGSKEKDRGKWRENVEMEFQRGLDRTEPIRESKGYESSCGG